MVKWPRRKEEADDDEHRRDPVADLRRSNGRLEEVIAAASNPSSSSDGAHREDCGQQKWWENVHDIADEDLQSNKHTPSELRELAAERYAADALQTPWQLRGPAGPQEGGPTTWRGQPYRAQSGKWAKRGGDDENQAFWQWYRDGMKYYGFTKAEAYRSAVAKYGPRKAKDERGVELDDI